MRAMKLFIPLMLASLLLAPMAMDDSGAVSNPLRIELDGPTHIAASEVTQFTLRLYGGPAEENATGEWSYVATLSMKNWTGAPQISPRNGSSSEPVFELTVTAPDVEQTITITIDATSTAGLESKTASRQFELEVVEPYTIDASVRNAGDIEAKGVGVSLFIDGDEIETKYLDLPAGGSANVTFIWTTYTDGKHTIEIRVDSEGDIVELTNGDNVLKETIYIGGDEPMLRMLYVLIVFGLLVALSAVTLWAKKKGKLFYR